jgi:hypothetical protein
MASIFAAHAVSGNKGPPGVLQTFLNGEEQGGAYYEQLECNKDYGNPIHDFLNSLHQQPKQWFKPNWMLHGIP